MSHPLIPLGQLVVARYGKALKELDRDERGIYSVFGSSGEVGRHSQHLIGLPTIVIGRKGSVGAVTYAPQGGWPIDTTFYLELLDSDRVDLRYLFWALTKARLGRRAITTSIPGLNRDELYRTRIFVPSISKQHHIVALLDKADAIRRKRLRSLRLLREFLSSAYMSMVGLKNPRHSQWPKVAIADLADQRDDAMRTGPFGSALRHDEFTNQGEVAVIGIDNAVENDFRWGQSRFITRKRYETNFKRYTVRAGDVLVTIMGTVGRSAVVPANIGLAISTKHLAVISVDRTRVYPEYLSSAIQMDPGVLAQINSAEHGAIMSGLSLGLVRRLRIHLPPMSEQRAFVCLVERARSLGARLGDTLEYQDNMAQSLMQNAFTQESLAFMPPL